MTMVGSTISHYRIVEKLGEGGMGVVYKAEDTKLKRTVALKFLPPELTRDPVAKERFVHEAQAASALQHNNICAIHDVDETPDGKIFMVMDCYEAETLKNRIGRSPLSNEETIEYAMQIAAGLAEAHRNGIVHRDIKPANILITMNGVAKIVDFGIAKLSNQTQLTVAGATVGTAAYMSPEQARGEPVDQRTDIWSLGVVMYEMLAGEPPFKSDYQQALVYSILNQDPKPISSCRFDISAELERIIQRAIMKNPNDRYLRADQMLTDLQREKQGGTILHLTRKTKRLLSQVALGTTLVIGLIAAYLWVIATREIDSIAVLPFTNLSADSTQTWADGVHEAIIGELGPIEALKKVISRQSTMQFRDTKKPLSEIARQLDVDVLVEGSVQQEGRQIRIWAQLIDDPFEKPFWANTYVGDQRDIWKLQKQVAREIAHEISIKITPQEEERLTNAPIVDAKAHEAYLRGRHFYNRLQFDEAAKLFQASVNLDPVYAPAFSGLALSYSNIGFMGRQSELPERAKAAAAKALEIDSTSSEAHAALAWTRFYHDRDIEGARKEFDQATEFNPNSASAHTVYSSFLTMIGEFEGALFEAKRAQQLDPLSAYAGLQVAWVLAKARRFEESIEQYKKNLEFDSLDISVSLDDIMRMYPKENQTQLTWVYIFKHDFASAYTLYKKLGMHWDDPFLGYLYAVTDRRNDALRIIDTLKQLSSRHFLPPQQIAMVYSGLRDNDSAFAWLTKAYNKRVGGLMMIKVDPWWDNIRQDPRFRELLRTLRLEE